MLCDTCGDRKPYSCHITPEAKHTHTKKSAGLISHWKSCVTFFLTGYHYSKVCSFSSLRRLVKDEVLNYMIHTCYDILSVTEGCTIVQLAGHHK